MTGFIEKNRLKLFFASIFLYIVGLIIELILIDHYESNKQIIPLSVLSVSFIAFILHGTFKNKTTQNIFRILMILSIISGFLGIYFHFVGNMEFEMELHPGASTAEWMMESIKGATPLMAPGSIIGLGLFGLIYTYYFKIN